MTVCGSRRSPSSAARYASIAASHRPPRCAATPTTKWLMARPGSTARLRSAKALAPGRSPGVERQRRQHLVAFGRAGVGGNRGVCHRPIAAALDRMNPRQRQMGLRLGRIESEHALERGHGVTRSGPVFTRHVASASQASSIAGCPAVNVRRLPDRDLEIAAVARRQRLPQRS